MIPVKQVGFSGGLHPYAYCDNDPHNRTDPDGREDEPKNPDHCGTLDAMTSPLMKVLSGIDGAVDALAEAAVNGANALTRPTMVSGTPTLGNAQYGGGKEGEAQRQTAKRAGKALNDAIEGTKKGIAKEALYQALGGALHAAGTLAEGARAVAIVERDGNVVRIVGRGPKGSIEVITSMRREGNRIILSGTHIDGPGAGKLGIRELGEFARQFARQEGVEEIVVEGAKRTTGARPGHVPRPFIFKVN